MIPLGALALPLLLLGAGSYLFRKRVAGDILTVCGLLLSVGFLGLLWANLGRPPLRTLGETRWWYATLVPTAGFLIGLRFGTRALSIAANLMGCLFTGINLAHPETMDKTLMPALQSPWFVPHVVVYMVAYAALGLSSLVGLWAIARAALSREEPDAQAVELTHNLVQIGFPLLTCGLVFGALWAKEAWGHYWTWDPKETWAFLTWTTYLIYLHVRTRHALKPRLNLSILAAGFAVLMLCWFGVNAMPTAAESVHTYSGPG